jgi:hypothetical protein
LGIVLDEQREKDIVKNIDGITFVVSPSEEKELKNVEILYSPYYVNDGFYVRAFKGRE